MDEVTSGGAIYYDEDFQEEVLSLLEDIEENTSVNSGSAINSSTVVTDENIDTILSLTTACTFCLSLLVGLLLINLFSRGLK